MRQLAYCLPTLPGFAGPKTFAAWPVWSDSTTKTIRFQPIPKREAVRLYHRDESSTGTRIRRVNTGAVLAIRRCKCCTH